MVRLAVAYVASLLVFLIVDGVIIFSFGAKLYKSTLGNVITDNFRVTPIVLFYLLFMFGLCYFAVSPAIEQNRGQIAVVRRRVRAQYVCDLFAYVLRGNPQLEFAACCYGSDRGTALATVVAVSAYFISTRF